MQNDSLLVTAGRRVVADDSITNTDRITTADDRLRGIKWSVVDGWLEESKVSPPGPAEAQFILPDAHDLPLVSRVVSAHVAAPVEDQPDLPAPVSSLRNAHDDVVAPMSKPRAQTIVGDPDELLV